MIFGIFNRRRRRKAVPLAVADETYLRIGAEHRFFEVGSRLVCPLCHLVLLRLTKPHRWGDVLKHTAVEQVENVYPAKFGAKVTCPEHGDVRPRVLPPLALEGDTAA